MRFGYIKNKFTVALFAMLHAAPLPFAHATEHHYRRGDGCRPTGFSGAQIRQMNVRNGVGSAKRRIAVRGF